MCGLRSLIVFGGVMFGASVSFAQECFPIPLHHGAERHLAFLMEGVDEGYRSKEKQTVHTKGRLFEFLGRKTHSDALFISRSESGWWARLASPTASIGKIGWRETVRFYQESAPARSNLISGRSTKILDAHNDIDFAGVGSAFGRVDRTTFGDTVCTFKVLTGNGYIGAELSSCRVRREFDGVLSGLSRLFTGDDCSSCFLEGFFQSVVSDKEDASTDNRGDEQQRGPSNQPASEAVYWSGVLKPPTLALVFGLAGLASALAGFLVLFGPHYRPQTNVRANAGASLFFGGLVAFAGGVLTAAALL